MVSPVVPGMVDCPGVVLDGFEVSGARGDGISMNTDLGTVRNCWVHNNEHMGVSSHSHRGVRIEANLIEFNGCNIQFHHGVYASGEGLSVCRNIVRHNSGYGLHLYPSIKGATVSQNLVFGHVYQSGIIVSCPEGGGRNLVVHNTVVGNRGGDNSHYCATKGGVIALTRSLAVEWAPNHIRVNAIAPGYFVTPMTDRLKNINREFYDELVGRVPLGRFGNSPDLAGAVVYLAGQASIFVTGHVLVIDGGYCAW